MMSEETTTFKTEISAKSESNSITVVGVSNASALKPGLPSCQSMSYIVGVTTDLSETCTESPEPFSAKAVSSLRNRLRARVSDSAFTRDSGGDI